MEESESAYRALPSVERVLQEIRSGRPGEEWPHDLLVEAVRSVLEEARREIAAGAAPPDLADICSRSLGRLQEWLRPTLQPAVNASGVILHTNLGRAPLSRAALEAVRRVSQGYCNLEFDLEAGRRGSRHEHARRLLCRLSGAESALAVNNNAAAVLLALSALARGRQVIVSRGQAVEIGGGFRIPEVMAQSGAILVEVGTTNRTYISDYAKAIGMETALLLRVHRSNFALVGFTHDVSLTELVELGHRHDIYVMDDLGSGTFLDTAAFGLAHEPMVQESVQAGADLVCFSGDKLLGGPQAGLIVGRADLIARLERHPLARAVRLDKMTLAALEATLLHYLRGEALREIPIWRMISQPLEEVGRRARRWRRYLAERGLAARVVPSETAVGGGSLPGQTLPTWALEIQGLPSADEAAGRLRRWNPPIIPRIEGDRLLLDARTVLPEQEKTLLEGLLALAG
ncbi:MAG: L-seryl-tRNA(Sec) selenium transferase [Chloroflexia bacterium]